MKTITLMIIVAVMLGCSERLPKPEVKIEDPTWPMPESGAAIELSKTEVLKKGDLIDGKIILNGLTLLTDTILPEGFSDAIPLTIKVDVVDGEVIKFRDGATSFVHSVNINKIGANGKYSFPVELIGYKSGQVSLLLSWKWPVATEGCCSIALLSILAGCNNNAACICKTMAAMAAPGSWCCSVHPKIFRYYWTFYGCTGVPPY